MSSQFTLPEILDVVEEAYQCIEVRTIAVEIGGKIYNVVTLIQFSTSSVDECEAKMRSRLAAHERLTGVPLQFDWMCLPATKLPKLAAQLKKGNLRVGSLTASLGAPVDLESFKSSISDDGYIRNPTQYPMFLATLSTFPKDTATKLGYTLGLTYSDDVLKQLRWCGFQWFRELATYYLGASNNDPSGPSFVAIVAPIPAMVDDRVELTPDGRRIRACVRLHPKLKGSLRLTGHIVDGNLFEGRIKGPLKCGELKLVNGNEAYAEAEFESTSPDDRAELCLVHDKISEIIQTPLISVRRVGQDGYPVPNVEGAAASSPEADRIGMSADSSPVRAKAVQSVLDELAKITPLMKSSIDYDDVRKQFPDSMTFKVCDGHRDLKLKLENIAGHQQCVRFAIEIVAANFGRKFDTVQKDWKTHKPRKEKADESSGRPGRVPKVRK